MVRARIGINAPAALTMVNMGDWGRHLNLPPRHARRMIAAELSRPGGPGRVGALHSRVA